MSTHLEHFKYELSSLASVVKSHAGFYETALLELMDMMFDDYLQMVSGDFPNSRLVNTQEKFEEMLENLHVRHKNAVTNYCLSEFKGLIDKCNQIQKLKMAS